MTLLLGLILDIQLIKSVLQREHIPLITASLDLSEDLLIAVLTYCRVNPSPLFEVNGIH